jgi:hypothetical protein
MTRKKTTTIPDEPVGPAKPEASAPLSDFVGQDRGLRDVSKPVAFDEHGRPLFAPRGYIVRWP